MIKLPEGNTNISATPPRIGAMAQRLIKAPILASKIGGLRGES